ncbi:cyclase family protein [Amycolatopsis sp. GM8]|uniref:cyclase family protein n=1 Tax=Amycolatopsis sp. GM8 TaxID=2896530 RepID=UPI001F345AC0|nr:cyclase family protein [Amycolatopsis sp. GM8]
MELDLPSNWGRWGPRDELGTLNFITAKARARGVAEARDGRVVSLARPVTPAPLGGPIPFGASPSPGAVLQAMNFTGSPARSLTDLLVINTHHASLTHIDALVHVPVDGQVYPGVPIAEAVVRGGVVHGSTTAFAGGITTRGVLLDLAPGGRIDPGHWVTGGDLDEAERHAGVLVESGDALVVRGGRPVTGIPDEPPPVMTPDAVRWLADREVSLYAGDVGDPPPLPGAGPMPMHGIALPRLGMPLIDGPDTDPLVAASTELGRHTFLFVLAAIPVCGATGVPVNPLAVF